MDPALREEIEGLTRAPEISYDPARCIGCQACVAACAQGAHRFSAAGAHAYDPDRCVRCGACVDTCYAGAMERLGQTRTAADVFAVVARDRPFYANSGGGMTLSGGEPLAQPEFTAALLRLSRQADVPTALETAALAPWELLESLLPLVDYWICDIKHADSGRHRELIGVGNERICANLERLARQPARLLLRLPLVPGLTDEPPALAALGRLVARLRPTEGLEIMPYHRLGSGKYERLGRPYPLADLPEATDDDIARAAGHLTQAGAPRVFCQRLPDL